MARKIFVSKSIKYVINQSIKTIPYRDENNNRCVIGGFIQKKYYNKSLEGKTIAHNKKALKALQKSGINTKLLGKLFLEDIQSAYDRSVDMGADKVHQDLWFCKEMEKICKIFRVKRPKILKEILQ